MKNWLPRLQMHALKKYLRKFPVTAVVGARQVGKTTLVKDLLAEERAYFSLDDPAVTLAADENPMVFLNQAPRITVDEIQKSPSLLNAIKRIVDAERKPGQFLITGSANITTLPQISETLAGRIAFVEMGPLTLSEADRRIDQIEETLDILSSPTATQCWKRLQTRKPHRLNLERDVIRGGYPSVCTEPDPTIRQEWFKAYVRTYLERDVRDLSRIQQLHEYQRFLSLAAFRAGQILNRANLARDAGVAYTTAGHFFDLLQATYQVFLLEPYSRNIGKRLIKAPKLMWCDTGLALHLQGITQWQDAARLGRSSFAVENKVALELKSALSTRLPLAKMFYWRTSGGAEVDLVIERSGQLIPIEIKYQEHVTQREVMGILNFMRDFRSQAPWGMVLYRGTHLLKLHDHLFLVPFGHFF